MRLFLLRHAIAKDGMSDESRPLGNMGLAQIERLCSFLNKDTFSCVAQIWHSPFVRAVQTASLFKQKMGIESPLVEYRNMRPIDDASDLARSIASISVFGSDLLLVGHNPNLEELAEILLGVPKGVRKTRFTNCALACFELEEMPSLENEYGRWVINFLIAPSYLT